MKKILYISFLNEDIRSGYKQKIHGEYQAFIENGLSGMLIIVGNRGIKQYTGKDKNPIIIDFIKKRKKVERNIYDELRTLKQWVDIVRKRVDDYQPDYIYIRRIVPITPKLISLINFIKSKNIKIVYEYPTLPWENEILQKPNKRLKEYIFFLLDKLQFNKLEKKVDLITYMGNYNGNNKKYVHLTNCGNCSFYQLKNNNHSNDIIRFIGVAHVTYWHGYDVLIDAINKYYKEGGNKKIYFDIVGNINPSLQLQKKVSDYGLEKYVIFHGEKEGKELDKLIDKADIGVNALRHVDIAEACKYGVTTLKTIEYTFRGMKQLSSAPIAISDNRKDTPPFIYITDLNININNIIRFYENCKVSEKEIRLYAENNLSWTREMNRVINLLEKGNTNNENNVKVI